MKHYISLEECQILYVNSSVWKAYPFLDRADYRREPKEIESSPTEKALRQLAEQRHLRGKKITLIMGAFVTCKGMVLPLAGRNELREMAKSKLIAEGKYEADTVMAIDIQKQCSRHSVYVMVYCISKKKMEEILKASEAAGLMPDKILVQMACMASAAKKVWKEHTVLYINAEENLLRVYGFWDGHCVACHTSSLKPGEFIKLGGEEQLLEEILTLTEDAGMAMEDCGADFIPECIVLDSSCFTDGDRAVKRIEDRLSLPCYIRTLKERNPCAAKSLRGHLKNLSGNKAVEITEGFSGGKRGPLECLGQFISREWALFLAMNLLLAAGLTFFTGYQLNDADRQLALLNTALDNKEYEKRYQKAVALDQRVEELSTLQKWENSLISGEEGENRLGSVILPVLLESLEPGMELESISYNKEEHMIQLTVSVQRAEQIPDLEERIKDKKIFSYVSHDKWERQEDAGGRCTAVIRVSLGEEGQNEIQ